MYLLVLYKDNLEIGEWEAKELLETENYEMEENYFIFSEGKIENIERLAYSRSFLSLLIRCPVDELNKNIENFDWESVYEKDFCVRIPQKSSLEREIADKIYRALETPKVNLENARTNIQIYFSEKEAFVCLLEEEIKHDFEERKSHKRPYPHPSSLHPKLARGMVNILNSEKIVDPFCGSGGILIEAGLMGKEIEGYDNDEIMIKRCKKNLENHGISDYKIEVKDSTNIKTLENFVTDLPYGRNTSKIKNLYEEFFKDLKFDRAVVGLCSDMEYKNLLDKNNIKIIKEFDYYLHKTLSKRILLIKKTTTSSFYSQA